MKRVTFSKMQALGNDFVLVDAMQFPVELAPGDVTYLADRKRGVGFDQLLLLERCDDGVNDCIYRIFNADGSEVSQCGNGARCVGLYLDKKHNAVQRKWRLKTMNSYLDVVNKSDQLYQVSIPAPLFDHASIPTTHHYEGLLGDVTYDGKSYQFSVASVGNPHICLVEEAGCDYDYEAMGRVLSIMPCFPEGVNVGFLQLESRSSLRLRVYERGAGMTEACGSGACAAMAVCRRRGLVDEVVTVKQLGGDLDVSWSGAADCNMSFVGQAEHVFEGAIVLN